jgi:hypothetical protein
MKILNKFVFKKVHTQENLDNNNNENLKFPDILLKIQKYVSNETDSEYLKKVKNNVRIKLQTI